MPANDKHPRTPSRLRQDDADTDPPMETALDIALREARREVGGSAPPPRHPVSPNRSAGPGRSGSPAQKPPPVRDSETGETPGDQASRLDDNASPREIDLAAGPAATEARDAPSGAAGSNRESTAEPDQHEPLVLEALLLQIPGFDALAMFKLGAAGLNRFATLALCTPEDIVAEAGVSLETARAVATEVEHWKGGLAKPLEGGEAQAAWRALEILLAHLETCHASLERASSGWSKEHVQARRGIRQKRERAYLAIKAALASVGELDLLLRLEKLPHARRIEELHRLLRAGAAAGVLSSSGKSPIGEVRNGRTHP